MRIILTFESKESVKTTFTRHKNYKKEIVNKYLKKGLENHKTHSRNNFERFEKKFT